MKKSLSLIAIMAALAAGSALAAPTPAGTQIKNTATATFDGGNATSNEVTTTVTALPNFTITPNGTVAAPAYDRTDVTAGSLQSFRYIVTNTGNTPVVVDLTTAVIPNAPVPTNIRYYADTNGNGVFDADDGDGIPEPGEDVLLTNTGNGSNGNASAVDTGVIPVGGSVTIFQVYNAPALANVTSGATPIGTATYDPSFNAALVGAPPVNPPNPSAGTLTTVVPDPGTGTGQLTDDQNYNRVKTVAASDLALGPKDNAPGSETYPTAANNYNQYADPTNPNTLIDQLNGAGTVAGDEQFARPLEDAETATSDVVTFINTVRNANTTAPDTVELIRPALPQGVSIVFQDLAGNLLPDVDGDGRPELLVPANSSVSFRVVVTYPDSNGPAALLSPIRLTIGVDSGNDGADTAADSTTVDTILPPALQFGDATTDFGTSPSPAPVEVVVPSSVKSNTVSNTDGRATFLMDIANTGGYAESYRVRSAPISVATSTGPVNVSAVYYTFTDNNGNGLFDGADVLGTPLPTEVVGGLTYYVTPVVAPGTELKVVAVFDLPTNATENNTYTVAQTVIGRTSTATRTDTNDIINVTTVGVFNLKKFVDNCTADPASCNVARLYNSTGGTENTARPGDVLRYTVIAQNNRVAPVYNVVLQDTLNPNLTFVSIVGSAAIPNQAGGQTVLFRVNGGGWKSALTAADVPTGALVEVGLDTDNNQTVNSNDEMVSGLEFRFEIRAQVK